jgi:hypothetical protein
MIDVGTQEKLEKLLKLALGSDRDGEVIAATRAIQRTLSNAGSDIHELAERIRGGKLSEAEMRKIYDAGYEAGKDEGAVEKGFGDVTAGPSWLQMAQYCAEHDNGRLTPREREFVDDMTRWCTRREPTEKQGKWLHLLYVRIGRRR